MTVGEITRYAEIKGLTLIGTGDFTHPKWLEELRTDLINVTDTNLYKSATNPRSSIRYMVSGEVCTIFTFEGKVRKIHHLILTPNLEIAFQINERLAAYGNLTTDGRPSLDMTAPHLVEEIMAVSNENVVIPAHVWTPWFSIFGAFSGFDRVKDCYQDMTNKIFALETGLSSDPPMNWKLSSLDKFALISNSDSHSPWPWRIGREANVFDLERLTYRTVVDAIREKDPKHYKFTIETNPAYGKYHWTGHRKCGVFLSPQEAIKLGNICPVCRRSLTKGVEQRVEELADRTEGFRPKNAISYIHLLPLSEIISTVMNITYPGAQGVWRIYNTLVTKFSDEYTVLIDAPKEEMCKVVDPMIAETIIRTREGQVKVTPGYDGVYGQIDIHSSENPRLRTSNSFGLDRWIH